jgi:hypothetical protein
MKTVFADSREIETTDLAADMIEKLQNLSFHSCRDSSKCELIPIREINADELADTQFCESPEHVGFYCLPMLGRDGKPVGGFGHMTARVEVYSSGTAVARVRDWKYAYSENEASLDGKKEVRRTGNHMTVKFYLLGCKHEYEERNDLAQEKKTTLYRCEHLHSCKKCGHWYVVDSSD